MFFCKCIPFCSPNKWPNSGELAARRFYISWRFVTFLWAQDSLHVGNLLTLYPLLDFLLYSFQEFTASAQAEPPVLHGDLFQGSSGDILLAAIFLGFPQSSEFLIVLRGSCASLSQTCHPQSLPALPGLVNALAVGGFHVAGNSPHLFPADVQFSRDVSWTPSGLNLRAFW